MKARIAIICLVLGLTFSAKAQYVTIPDANFVTFLQTNFPGCMSGNQMDTTCTAITNATYLYVNTTNITNLTGIQYFDNLDSLDYSGGYFLTTLPALPNSIRFLDIYGNLLTSLPPLPTGLIQLNCQNNQLTSLPALPNTLVELRCGYNQITSLPALPNSLLYLLCYLNQLTSLPILPSSLQEFYCNDNLINSMPALPSTLNNFACYNNQLTSLPSLPSSLHGLWCNGNQITNLPSLPATLTGLNCSNNLLTSLPALPSSLTGLDCSSNFLTNLPALDSSLTYLSCQNNQLTSIPALPYFLDNLNCSNNFLTNLPVLDYYLGTLDCSNNNISCFSTLPNNFFDSTFFNISGNPFTCLPNYIQGMGPSTLAYPLCILGDVVNNPNNCANAQGIIGNIFQDMNVNYINDTGDSLLLNIPIKLYDNSSNLISQTYPLINGIYNFPEPAGTYTVKIDTVGMPYMIQCASPGIDSTVVLTTANPLQTNVNFSVVCKPGFDIGIQSVFVQGQIFPGQQHFLKSIVGDLSNWYNLHCASGVSGQMVVSVNGPVTFISDVGSITPTVLGNIFTYTIPDFGALSSLTILDLKFTTDTLAVTGDSICVNVTVTPTTGDNNTSNNTFNYCYYVGNSYDPNFKETYPETVQPGFNDYFYYTLHFQNVGSSSAINIHLQDTLDANLDLNTFQVINYSHQNTTWLTGNKLSVNFPNIMLADSTTDFDGSQGYVQYRIKPLTGLPGGTQIHNKASIYFDYNAPVVTNTTVNEFMLSIGLNQFQVSGSKLQVYPNPSNGKYFVKLSEGTDVSKLSVEVTNLLGEIILQSKIQHPISGIDLSNQPKGIYFVRVIGAGQALNQRVVKQ